MITASTLQIRLYHLFSKNQLKTILKNGQKLTFFMNSMRVKMGKFQLHTWKIRECRQTSARLLQFIVCYV